MNKEMLFVQMYTYDRNRVIHQDLPRLNEIFRFEE